MAGLPAAPSPAPALPVDALARRRLEAATGHQIGLAHARRGIEPPLALLDAPCPVRQGWDEGRRRWGAHTLPAGGDVQRWLQAWTRAWCQGLPFDADGVNPAFLRSIRVTHCPVTTEPLGGELGLPGDACVISIAEDGGWRVGDLVVVSRRAADALGGRSAAEALRLARALDEAGAGLRHGLAAAHWHRYASLLALATPMAHARAAVWPLRLLPPPRLHLRNAAQALQVLLSLQFTPWGHPRQCATLAEAVPTTGRPRGACTQPGGVPALDGEIRHAFHAFMHTLRARMLAIARQGSHPDPRRQLETAWHDPLLNTRWQRLALRLDSAACAQLVHAALRSGQAGPALRWHGDGLTGPGAGPLPVPPRAGALRTAA